MMIARVFCALGLVIAVFAGAAQACPRAYQVVPGDSLSAIAVTEYQNAFLWTDIYAANRALIGDDPDTILHGTVLTLPCPVAEGDTDEPGLLVSLRPPPDATRDQQLPAVTAAEIAKAVRSVDVVGLANLAPFSDEGLDGGGLAVDLVVRALAEIDPTVQADVRFMPAKAAEDALSRKVLPTVIIPATTGECAHEDTPTACEGLLVSTPLFEALEVLFVRADNPLPMSSPLDMHGRRLCRPLGLSLEPLNASGRKWVDDDRITLVQHETVEGCFRALQTGAVDGVAIDEFTGRNAVQRIGSTGDVVALTKTPLGVFYVRAGIPQDAPDAGQIISDIDAGVSKMRENGTYRRVILRHVADHWRGS